MKHFLMLFLHSFELFMGLFVYGSKLILIILVDDFLNLFYVTRLELLFFWFSVGSCNNGHLLGSLLSVLLSFGVSWRDFNPSRSNYWVLRLLGSAGTSLSSFLSVSICLFAGGRFFPNFCKLSILILWLYSALVKKSISYVFLVLQNLSFSIAVVRHNNLFLVSVFKIRIINSSLLVRVFLFCPKSIVVIFLLQSRSHAILFLVVLISVNRLLILFSSSISFLGFLLSLSTLGVLIIPGWLAISQARFWSRFRGSSSLLHGSSSSLIHLIVNLVSLIHSVTLSIVVGVFVLIVLALWISLISLVIGLHIFFVIILFDFYNS